MKPEERRSLLGDAIARARTAAGLTQEALGVATGLGQTVVSRIESGERKVEALELARIAGALAIAPGELLAAVEQARAPEAATSEAAWEVLALRLQEESPGLREAFGWVEQFLADFRRLRDLVGDA